MRLFFDRSLGRQFGWLWAAYAISAYGSGLGFGAFALVAILALDAGPAQVALLSAAGLAAGALAAVPLGAWIEPRRKRPVMIAADLVRFAALASVPVAYACDRLGYLQLLAVAVVVAAGRIVFAAASGAYLKTLLPPERLLAASARFEAATWGSLALGPPLGGAAVGLFGPVVTLAADAVSHLLSALGIVAIGGGGEPARGGATRAAAAGGRAAATPDGVTRADRRTIRAGELLAGWRFLLAHPGLRPLFLNALAVNGLIMATEPLLAVLMLDQLGFPPWQYGLAFAIPCAGGLIGSRLARPLVARVGAPAVIRVVGALRACWPIGLAFVGSGLGGLTLVIAVELGLILCASLFNPVLAAYRLEQLPPDRVARTLTAWSVSSSATIATLTALWGLLAALTNPRAALALAGLLLLATPLLLPRRGDDARET